METIRHEVWIGAHEGKVFEAITSRAGLDAWWGKALNGKPEIGFVVEFDHSLGEPLKMRITDLIPNQRLVWKCVSDFSDPGNPASEWLGHQLVFELEAGRAQRDSEWLADRLELDRSGFTILKFMHAGWDRDSRWFAFCSYAWGVTLDALKRYCETGHPTSGGEHRSGAAQSLGAS